MKQHVRLKFKSRVYGEEILAMCRVHGISFAQIAADVNERKIIIEPGSVDLTKIDIGKKRFLENPSQRLDDYLYGCVCGTAHAMHTLGTGKRVLEEDGEILEGLDLFPVK